MANKKTISVAIAVFNEEKNIDACLRSVQSLADEIVVVDGGSTDKTVEIARNYTNKIIQTDNPPIFHINKQKALDACTKDWILQLDADEVIPDQLKKEILEAVKQPTYKGYYIPRKNFFWGKWMKKGGQYPDYVIRLMEKGYARFPSVTVHEQIEIDGKVGYLQTPMEHYSYRTNNDYWKKADTYTTLSAMEMKKNGVKKSVATWFSYNVIKPKMTFLNLFIRHKGFLDGWRGFVFAVFSAWHFPIAYRKFTKIAVILLFFLLCTTPVRAEYVLPYPSYMPGSIFYKVSRVIDTLKNYWYFGNISQFKYRLALSDKYLVEAKTLMEYKQYLLATEALQRSDREFTKIPEILLGVKSEHIDILRFKQLADEASIKHEAVLTALLSVAPTEFLWQPEKSESTSLPLEVLLKESIASRQKVRDQIATL